MATTSGKGGSMKGTVRIGTSGYVYPHWSGIYYPEDLPEKKWFDYYLRDFDTVEINNTFYRLPDPEVFEKWGEAAPEGFLYTFKMSRYLTHVKKLKDAPEPLGNFLSRARGAGRSLGPFLCQLPPRWNVNTERLENFFKALPEDDRFVLEFRDDRWHCEEVQSLLEKYDVTFCIHDHPDIEDCPEWVTSDTVYLRFHGPSEEEYAGSYPEEFLNRIADKIAKWHGQGLTVFVYFNNDVGGHAVTNALDLKSMLESDDE